MIRDETVLSLHPEVSFESLSDGRQTVILHLASGHIFTCNATTAAFLRALDGRRPFREVLDRLQAEFDVERERLATDLSAMAEQLLSEGLVRNASEPRPHG